MTKRELATRLACETGFTTNDALRAVEGLMTVMADTFAAGHNIYLRGFGTFKVSTRKPKTAFDFNNKKPIDLPARSTVKFKPCEELKTRLNNG